MVRRALDLVAAAASAASVDSVDLGGTIRECDAASTLARTRDVLRPLGITRVANVTGLDHVGVPTWVAVRPLARSLSVAQGKGLTHELARVSAIMECIELHHAEHFLPRGHVQTLAAAAGDASYADPLLFPVDPHASVHPASAVEWIEGNDLIGGTSRWLPRDCIDIDSVSASAHTRVYVGSSNGLASGNTRNEATLHALCEVIERDQQSFWHARKHLALDERPSRVRLDSVDDTHCRRLLDRCRDAGLDIVVWYVTQNLVLPCFVCTIFDSQANTLYPQRASGAGCHPYRRVAFARAVTEALQSRLTHVVGGRDDMHWSLYRGGLNVDDEKGRNWGNALLDEPERVAFADVPQAAAMPGIDALLDWVLATLRSQGFAQAILVDLTQAGIGIPVVHLSVPGLESSIATPQYTPGPRMQQLVEGRIAS